MSITIPISGYVMMRRSHKLLLASALLISMAILLGGCTSSPKVEPPGIDHPANPDAAVAPVAPMSDTLNTRAVKAPEKQGDPHAGHMMH